MNFPAHGEDFRTNELIPCRSNQFTLANDDRRTDMFGLLAAVVIAKVLNLSSRP